MGSVAKTPFPLPYMVISTNRVRRLVYLSPRDGMRTHNGAARLCAVRSLALYLDLNILSFTNLIS